MEEETKYGVIKIMKETGDRVLWRDGRGVIFSVQNSPYVRNYLDAFFATKKPAVEYEMVSLDTYLGKTHDLTLIIANADIL
jgi:hypothetical protein